MVKIGILEDIKILVKQYEKLNLVILIIQIYDPSLKYLNSQTSSPSNIMIKKSYHIPAIN